MVEVVVTRKGQTTIPVALRRKYGLREGSRLTVEDTGKGILFIPCRSFLTYAGSGKNVGRETVEELKELLDRMRNEDA